VRLFDDIGMDLFQEKQGFMWRNSGAPIPPPGRLRFASVLVTGRDLYRDVMARAGRDTLDRNDRWYRDHMDEAHWAAQMMEYLQEQDAQSWLVAADGAGDRVGMVAVSTVDPGSPPSRSSASYPSTGATAMGTTCCRRRPQRPTAGASRRCSPTSTRSTSR
jgi:hypothetical protein